MYSVFPSALNWMKRMFLTCFTFAGSARVTRYPGRTFSGGTPSPKSDFTSAGSCAPPSDAAKAITTTKITAAPARAKGWIAFISDESYQSAGGLSPIRLIVREMRGSDVGWALPIFTIKRWAMPTLRLATSSLGLEPDARLLRLRLVGVHQGPDRIKDCREALIVVVQLLLDH